METTTTMIEEALVPLPNPQSYISLSSSAESLRATSINDLPYDLLSEILCYARRTSNNRSTPHHPSASRSCPTEVGAVCTYWRETVWSTPRLWTSFTIDNKFWKTANRTAVLRLYFQNAGNHALDITFTSLPRDYTSRRSTGGRRIPGEDVFDTIFTHNPNRLGSLTFTQYPVSWFPYISEISKSPYFSNLQSLNVRDLRFGTANISQTITLHLVPRLTTLSLHGTTNTIFIFPPDVWSHILHLKLSSIPSTAALQLALNCATHLETLTLTLLDLTELDDDSSLSQHYSTHLPNEPITFPNLKSFSFGEPESDIPPQCWDSSLGRGLLLFPSLTHLTFTPCDPLLFDYYRDFMRDHIPTTLTHLTLRCTHSQEFVGALHEAIPRLGALESLQLVFVFMRVSVDVINLLRVGNEGEEPVSVPLPNLFELGVEATEDDDFLFGLGGATGKKGAALAAILEVARERLRLGRTSVMLRRLGLGFGRPICAEGSFSRWPDYVKEDLKELIGEGLEVEIGCYQSSFTGL
ncbi:hypothetical protein P691DRAFT_779873 [Macrolepiota fuliginosa MF-IS2]|uniref:F-box domain-containing protein n=1 Tax=Macrolepiota fuliginosa MF-IS2 TaxID=1400762 RepID=A0A9P5X0T8_9AGAR|nr:hypothetical protein P691DRAFT_779873 [Macrolepiota fuliginosa MF-IS2]